MFQLILFDDKQDEEGNFLDIIAIRFINCKKETGLYPRDKIIEEIITKFVLNAILHCFSDLWAENGPLLGPTDLDIYDSTDGRGINHSRKGIVIHGKEFY